MAKKKKKKKKTRPQKRAASKPQPQKQKREEKPAAVKKTGSKKFLLFIPFVLLLAAAVLVVIFLSSPRKKVLKESGLNVLLVTLDTTRADRLGCYGYLKAETPNLDYLAANGVLFLNTYCPVPLTCPSHCSILTGTYPLFHQVRNNGTYTLSPELETLAEALKIKGLKTAAFVSSFTVDSRFGLDQGFDVYDDQLAPDQTFKALTSERKADKVFDSFSRWMDRNTVQPFFVWIHFFDPHLPYDPPSPYREQFPDDPYDGEIAYMDFYVGKILDKLRELGLLSNTLIILAGDHGEAFGEKQEKGHGIFIYEHTMRVPLIFYAESNLPQGEIIESRVRLIDIMPSILDMLDTSLPESIQGTSLLPFIEGKNKDDLSSYIESYYPRENFGWSELLGLIDGEWKYIKAPHEELYNLKQDPQEEKNLIQEERKIVQEKRDKLEDIIQSSVSPLVAGKRKLSAEERNRLRSLGYIAASEGPSQGDFPDPKDRIEELLLIQQAEAYEVEDRIEEAAAIYEKIIDLRPNVATSYVNLALMKARMMKLDETIQILEQGIEKIPDSEVLLSRLGHTFMAVGRLKKALEAFDRVLKNNPRHFDALLGSAWMFDLMGQKEDALAYYQKALAIEPENKFGRKNYALSLATSGNLNQAIEIYKDLKRDFPDDYEIYQDLGIAYGHMGEVHQAIENLEMAIGLHPTPVAYFNLAVAKKKLGRIEEAARYIRLYLENPEGESEESIQSARAELEKLEEMLKK
jgi:arylsulfatase A-like enzyme/Flp pilus assembly protein TadD